MSALRRRVWSGRSGGSAARYGEGEDEAGAAFGAGLGPECASVGFDEAARDREAESGAARIGGSFFSS